MYSCVHKITEIGVFRNILVRNVKHLSYGFVMIIDNMLIVTWKNKK